MTSLATELEMRHLTLLRMDSRDEQLSMIFQWAKTDVITKGQFIFLIKEIV